jgi:hypothetical protein
MSDDDKKALATRVVDAMYGPLFDQQFKRPGDVPEEVREKFAAQRRKALDEFRNIYIELYSKHMDREQLEFLLDFQESDMGKAVKEAQKRIHAELNAALKRSGIDTGNSGGKGANIAATVEKIDRLESGD